MARDRKTAAGMESLDTLARKAEILERELAVQRDAIDRLKQLGSTPQAARESSSPRIRKSA